MINLGTYLKQYRVGDIVDVVANGAVQKGMVSTISRRERMLETEDPGDMLHLSSIQDTH